MSSFGSPMDICMSPESPESPASPVALPEKVPIFEEFDSSQAYMHHSAHGDGPCPRSMDLELMLKNEQSYWNQVHAKHRTNHDDFAKKAKELMEYKLEDLRLKGVRHDEVKAQIEALEQKLSKYEENRKYNEEKKARLEAKVEWNNKEIAGQTIMIAAEQAEKQPRSQEKKKEPRKDEQAERKEDRKCSDRPSALKPSNRHYSH